MIDPATTCRVLPHGWGDGPTNMATDEALLDAVDADRSSLAVVRTYEWSAPTLSLGYFQAIAEAEADPRWRDVPIVRRPTGGGALWHDREVTYAVVIPGTHPLSRPSSALYRAVHAAIARSIADLGIAARRHGDLPATAADDPRPFLCFGDRNAEDIVAGAAKLVGSAQRRRRGSGAVLQHGSLLLRRSDATPELPGLVEAGMDDIPPSAWAARLATILPRCLGLEPIAGDLTTSERRAISRLAAGVYASNRWTRSR